MVYVLKFIEFRSTSRSPSRPESRSSAVPSETRLSDQGSNVTESGHVRCLYG